MWLGVWGFPVDLLTFTFNHSKPGGGGRLGCNYARICVSKSEGHGSFWGFKGVK